jgi:hypothetical protein
MVFRIATCILAIVAALTAMSLPGAAYASGKRQQIPFVHADARGFEPPDPCKGHCGGLFAGRFHR